MVWDKAWIGPGGQKGLRPSYEMVALWCMPDFSIGDRGLPDIQRFPWSGHKPTGHPAEKPVAAIRWILEQSGIGKGATVLDPFTGSGTTGAACQEIGASFIGCEMSDEWARYARTRIAAADPMGEQLFIGDM